MLFARVGPAVHLSSTCSEAGYAGQGKLTARAGVAGVDAGLQHLLLASCWHCQEQLVLMCVFARLARATQP
jgi:hypothetical protein